MKKYIFTVIFIFGFMHSYAYNGSFISSLDGNQVNPSVSTNGTGFATFTLTPEGLVFKVTITGLSSSITSSHIHSGNVGVSGGVLLSLTSYVKNDNLIEGTISNLTDSQKNEIISGKTYINVHTSNFPSGEIRGQIYLESVFLNSSQSTITSELPGTGLGKFYLNKDKLLMFQLNFENLTGEIQSAHIHNGVFGSSGGVLVDLTAYVNGNSIKGSVKIDDNTIDEILAGRAYVNVHTAENPAGEIRGQVQLENTFLKSSNNNATGVGYFGFISNMLYLTGSQENPSVNTQGFAKAYFYLVEDKLSYFIETFDLSSSITGSHIHEGSSGNNGSVLIDLSSDISGSNISGSTTLTNSELTSILSGNTYINIHTENNPSGEVRAQVVLNTLYYNVETKNLSGNITSAHIHFGGLNETGGVALNLSSDINGTSITGVYHGLTQDLMGKILSNDTYLNIHTLNFQVGEIRGQVKLLNKSRMSIATHITLENDPFNTLVRLTNDNDNSRPYFLRAYASSGAYLRDITLMLNRNSISEYNSSDLLNGSDVAYFEIFESNLRTDIGYALKNGEASPVFISTSNEESFKWRVYTGNWDIIFDGFAIINTGDEPAVFSGFYKDINGNIIENLDFNSGNYVAPMEKILIVAGGPDGGQFSYVQSAFVEVISTNKFVFEALGGTVPGSQLGLLWKTSPFSIE